MVHFKIVWVDIFLNTAVSVWLRKIYFFRAQFQIGIELKGSIINSSSNCESSDAFLNEIYMCQGYFYPSDTQIMFLRSLGCRNNGLLCKNRKGQDILNIQWETSSSGIRRYKPPWSQTAPVFTAWTPDWWEIFQMPCFSGSMLFDN